MAIFSTGSRWLPRRAPSIANLQAGFEVCGTFLDRRKILKVILQKHLP